MADEIQSGMGRTGTFLACEHYGVKPDIATLAKGIAGGIPAGAVLANDKAADVLQTGDHGSTFGGNVLAAAAGLVVLETLASNGFLKAIAQKGDYLMNGLRGLNLPVITSVRGMGLMAACDLNTDAWPVVESALQNGLLMLTAGQKTLRFLPPYIITESEIDAGLDILRTTLKDY
jgi:acetylornithine/N-succinyldiaminopimelate aminotransferase